MTRRRIASPAALLLTLLMLCMANTAEAQSAPAGLRSRMDAFAAALREMAPMVRIAGFFPRVGEWEMIRTPTRAVPGAVVNRSRFAPGQTLAAISEGGAVCGSFGGVVGDVGPYDGALVAQANSARAWRYVGRYRFVPPDGRADSPIYVQWAREHGAWVIARIGEEYEHQPRVAGRPAAGVLTRDTTAGNLLPAERRYGRSAAWFTSDGPIDVGGHWYFKYGLPRTIDERHVVRIGSVDVVPVFAEPAAAPMPEVMYVLAGPGEYQPYMGFGHSICRA
jgi:hypothetical protein